MAKKRKWSAGPYKSRPRLASGRAMFGTTVEGLEANIERWARSHYAGSRGVTCSSYAMLAMSILSDAQEEMAMGNVETGRQFINRAKYVLSQKIWQPGGCRAEWDR